MALLDPGDRVLLIATRDRSGGAETRRIWHVPGGGVEPGESLADTARREVAEETGVVLGDLGPVIWTRRAVFEFGGTHYDEDESYFAVRVTGEATVPTALTDREQRDVDARAWWSTTDLVRLSERGDTVYPVDLAEVLDRWLASGPPSLPQVLR